MSVVVEFSLAATDFELGRIFNVDPDSLVESETLVPLGSSTDPLFWVHNLSSDSFLDSINSHPAVRSASEIDTVHDRRLFRLDWKASLDDLISGIEERGGYILNAIGQATNWEFEVRFPSHETLRSFSNHCDTAGITLTIQRVYTPSEPKSAPSDGLTDPQAEALTLAIERGYYSIPRGCSTKKLGDELGISDQAVTERLRRAIVALSTSTLDTLDTDS